MGKHFEDLGVADPHLAIGYRKGDDPFGDGSGREGKGSPQKAEADDLESPGGCDGHVPQQFPARPAIVIYPIGWWGKSPNEDPPAHNVTACY